MARKKNRRARFAPARERIGKERGSLGVERGKRLVEENHGGRAEECAREARALALAAREHRGPRIRAVGKTDFAKGVVDGARDVAGGKAEACDEREILRDREIVVEGRAVARKAERAPGGDTVAEGIVPADAHLARGGSFETGEDPEDRRLAGSIAPHEDGRLAGVEEEGDVRERERFPVPLRDTADVDHASTCARRVFALPLK